MNAYEFAYALDPENVPDNFTEIYCDCQAISEHRVYS